MGDRCVGPRQPWIFMQDLAPPHNARTTRELLAGKKVRVLDWAGNSRDLNPIEHVWAYVARRLPRTLPGDTEDLWARVQKA